MSKVKKIVKKTVKVAKKVTKKAIKPVAKAALQPFVTATDLVTNAAGIGSISSGTAFSSFSPLSQDIPSGSSGQERQAPIGQAGVPSTVTNTAGADPAGSTNSQSAAFSLASDTDRKKKQRKGAGSSRNLKVPLGGLR